MIVGYRVFVFSGDFAPVLAKHPNPNWCHWRMIGDWKCKLRSAISGSASKIFQLANAVTVNVVWYALKRCCGDAGLSNLTPHDLRRTCAVGTSLCKLRNV